MPTFCGTCSDFLSCRDYIQFLLYIAVLKNMPRIQYHLLLISGPFLMCHSDSSRCVCPFLDILFSQTLVIKLIVFILEMHLDEFRPHIFLIMFLSLVYRKSFITIKTPFHLIVFFSQQYRF